MKKYLKPTGFAHAFVGMVLISVLFSACESPSEVVLSPFDEVSAYFEFVMTNDDFFTSEEDILHDPDATPLGKAVTGTLQELQPVHVFRRIQNIERSFSHEFVSDTLAIVTMTRNMDVKLFIYGYPVLPGGHGPPTVISKDFIEFTTRKAMFVKVSNTGPVEDDWKLVAILLLEGGTPERDFDIQHLIVDFQNGITYSYDDPLDTFLRIAFGNRNVPTVTLARFIQDGFELEITLESTNPEPEILYLRHGGGVGWHNRVGGYMRRVQAGPPDDEEIVGDRYIRTYVIEWTPGFPGGFHQGGQILKGRFSTIVEAVSYESLHQSAAPVQTNYWGVPFIIE